MGHYASNCANPGDGGLISLNLAYTFTQHFDDIIKRSWVLLDTACSAVYVGSNEENSVSIRKCTPNEIICVRTNGGSKK